ncbi:hypothetical protein NL676_033854 [Syzygium grande]|nr:hypothetical protein NL676_033854 [Syzygium grande]
MDENKIQNLLQRNHYVCMHSHFILTVQANTYSSNIGCTVNKMAIMITEGYSYSGAKGDTKVFNPHVERDDEWTTSQIALKSAVLQDYECMNLDGRYV